MRKYFVLFLCTILLVGCSRQDETIHPDGIITTNTYTIDTAQAAAMIDEAEWWQAWLSEQDSISRTDAEMILQRLETVCKSSALTILQSFMTDTTAWDNGDANIPLGNGTVVPTLYHNDVIIDSATVEEQWTDYGGALGVYYESRLTIRKIYTGTNASLESWEESYIFQRFSEDDAWEFLGVSGYYNILSDEAMTLSDAFFEKDYT